jgi:transmembrane sensor
MGTGPTGETPSRGSGCAARAPAIADEAAEWLATLTDSGCTEDERHAFVAWLRRSNLHVEEFLRISTLARRLSGPGALPPADVAELVRRAKESLSSTARVTDMSSRSAASREPTPHASETHRSPESPRAPNARRARRMPLRWAIAASIAAVTLVGLIIARYGLLDFGPSTYSTSLGELRSITLEDGSIVELNTRSTLRTRFTPAERRVELLSGEAVFKVARNPASPFRVVAGSAQIVAVGTAFNVYAQSTRTVVTVLEGRVRVRNPQPAALAEQEIELARGEQAIVAPHGRIAKATLSDPQRVTSWTERRLVFEETPLAEVAAEFARYDAHVIRIDDAKLGELHITGVFDATDPASLVQFVEAYGSVSVQADERGWTLSRTD